MICARLAFLGLTSVASLVLLAERLPAQTNRLTVLTLGGFPLTAPTASALDFDVGSVSVGTTTFTVDLTSNAGQFATRVVSVDVSCGAGCPGTVSALQWRDSDAPDWISLGAGFVTVRTQTSTFNDPATEPWTVTLLWRYQLSWTGSPPTAAQQFPVVFRMTTTAP